MVQVEGLEGLRLIGSGGFADVYEGHEPAFSRNVAVKVFRFQLDGESRRGFEREAKAMGRLSGIRNVVQVYRSGVTTDDRPFLAMELMNGSMADVLSAGPVAPASACSAGQLLGRALAEAHARGVLHRDIKPANILIDRYGEPTLSDFGISSLNDVAASVSVQAFTAEHAAPELFDEGRSTAASDVYSLASTIYTMLEGRAPFERRPDEGPLAFMNRVRDTPCEPSRAAAQVSPDLDALIRAGLAKRPEDRPSLDELVAGLEPWATPAVFSAGAAARPPSEPVDHAATAPPPSVSEGTSPAKRNRAVLAAAAVLVLVLLVGAGWMVTRGDSGDEDAAADTTTTTATDSSGSDSATTLPPRKYDGVANLELASDTGLSDTSSELRDRIDAFAEVSDVPVVNAGPGTQRNSSDLKFGELPARMDYVATNKIPDAVCRKIYLDDIVVQGAAATLWGDGSQLVLVNAVQLETELQARQYFWSTALYLGVPDEDCSGWPESRIAVNPDDLTVDREDFAVNATPDDLITVINNDPQGGGIAYEVAFRVDDIVVVASVGWTDGAAGVDSATASTELDRIFAAFQN